MSLTLIVRGLVAMAVAQHLRLPGDVHRDAWRILGKLALRPKSGGLLIIGSVTTQLLLMTSLLVAGISKSASMTVLIAATVALIACSTGNLLVMRHVRQRTAARS